MKFKGDFLRNYLNYAPLPLARERAMECVILSGKSFTRPILDIGCGDGIFAYNLFAEQIDLGIDPNPKEIQSARKRNIYKELIICYGDRISKPSGMFNTIFSNSVLEHIPEIDKVLKEAHRLLSSEGKMYLTLPTNLFEQYTLLYQFLIKLKLNNLANKYQNFFNKFWRHYHCYDVKGWSGLFTRCGFKVIDVEEYGSLSMCMTNDILAPFSLLSFILKKITNEWVWSTTRKMSAPFLNKIWKNYQELDFKNNLGGLVFFEIQKKCP